MSGPVRTSRAGCGHRASADVPAGLRGTGSPRHPATTPDGTGAGRRRGRSGPGRTPWAGARWSGPTGRPRVPVRRHGGPCAPRDRPGRRARRAPRGARAVRQRQDHAPLASSAASTGPRRHACWWTTARSRRLRRTSSWTCGGGPSRSSTRPSGSCRSSPPRRTSRCRCGSWHADPAERDARVAELLELVGPGGRGRGTGRTSCRAASSSASPSRARSRTGRACCSPTSPRASSTPTPGTAIMTLLRAVVRADGVTAIVATHDPVMLDVADRVVELRDGRLV